MRFLFFSLFLLDVNDAVIANCKVIFFSSSFLDEVHINKKFQFLVHATTPVVTDGGVKSFVSYFFVASVRFCHDAFVRVRLQRLPSCNVRIQQDLFAS